MYYTVCKWDGNQDVISAEFLYSADAFAWAADLERRGWSGVVVYEVER
jgi:hypothetical protein